MIRIHEIKLNIHQTRECIPEMIVKKLHIHKDELLSYRIYRESIDARKKDNILFSYCVDCEVKNENRLLKRTSAVYCKTPDMQYHGVSHGDKEMKCRPVVIGFGPAGMMAALLLAQEGYEPIVYERGSCVEKRVRDVEEFWNTGMLNENSNVQFGEGGAGTFSDGKLTTRVKDVRSRKVLEELVAHGAPEEILYEAHPHIGTDLLRDIVRSIREDILSLGGVLYFDSPVESIRFEQGAVTAIKVHEEWITCSDVILAIGHSARDTFEMLYEKDVDMSPKAFAVGARIEHEQQFITEQQYGCYYDHPSLPTASYRFVHTAGNGRGVYTFCMCPGGTVVPSSSSKGELVVNGMSEHARNGKNANSALLVQVTPADFGAHPLDGMRYQQQLEQKAYKMGKESWRAPAQKVEDFLLNRKGNLHGTIQPSYALGVEACNLQEVFPEYVTEALLDGIRSFDKRMPGFARHAVLTAVETRSSSPLRINRDKESLQSLNKAGLYPCGEGAGYAGGIVSAAIDGIRCAEKIIENYKNQRD